MSLPQDASGNARLVELSISGTLARLQLNRPEKRNAVNIELAEDFRRAVEFITARGATVAWLSAVGSIFCAGIDIKCNRNSEAADIVLDTIRGSSLFWGATVAGPAIGFAVAFLTEIPVVVASNASWFSLPEVTGIRHFPIAIFERLDGAIAPRQAFNMAISAGQIGASDPRLHGLVSESVPAGEEQIATDRWTRHLMELDPSVLRQAQIAWRQSLRRSAVPAG